MENASQALIIAGSILLSILIIALGMYIYNSSSSVKTDSTISDTQKQTHNEKFTRYKGEQSGSNVLALISAARTNASANKDNVEYVPSIVFRGEKNGKGYVFIKTATGSIKTGKSLIKNENENQNLTAYNKNLTLMEENTENSHTYKVTIDYA